MKRFRRRREDVFLARLCADVSQVLNRVRQGFASIPMKAVANLPQICAAEQEIERVSGALLKGLGTPEQWQEALAAYEAVWMAALRDLKQVGKQAA
ncbi:MAG: hypothetical protein O2954_20285 [bacterium]|nr:hypothetical protein [bacterium]